MPCWCQSTIKPSFVLVDFSVLMQQDWVRVILVMFNLNKVGKVCLCKEGSEVSIYN